MRELKRSVKRLPPVKIPAGAVGAIAVGAIAIGAMAIGQVAVRKARLGSIEADDLTVRRWRVIEAEKPGAACP
jgi:hypothetical protein